MTPVIVYGVNPVLEALRASPERIRWIGIRKGSKEQRLGRLADEARKAGVVVRPVDDAAIRRQVPRDAVHNGVIAEVGEVDLVDPWPIIKAESTSLIVILDQVSDPHNVGAIIRNADALGADLVVVPEHRSAALNAAVVKSSAGAASWVPVAQVTNLARLLDDLKEEGYWSYGLDAAGQPIEEAKFGGRVVIVLGSEGKGLRPNVRKHCDAVLSIPMSGHVDSLNVASAAAITLWEVARQRRSSSA